MANLTRVTGLSKVIGNLKKAGRGYQQQLERGLKRGGIFVLRKSQKVVPIDTANLKGGGEVRNVGGKGEKTDVVVLYKANYSVYVHEDMNAQHNKGKTAKFLENAVRQNKEELFKIIAKG